MRHSAGPGVRGTEHALHDLMKVNLLAKTHPPALTKPVFALMLSRQRKHFEVYQYANPVHQHPLERNLSLSPFWLTNHVSGSSLAAVDAVSCDVGWGGGLCNTPAGLDPPGSGDLGLKRHKEIPLKEQRVSRFTWFRSHRPESLFHSRSHPLLKVTYSDLTHF